MATIKQAQAIIKAASKASAVEAGHMYLMAQRIAKKSRAACAHDVMCSAHLGAVMSLNRATDSRDRSILGRIRRESQFLFNGAL